MSPINKFIEKRLKLFPEDILMKKFNMTDWDYFEAIEKLGGISYVDNRWIKIDGWKIAKALQ